ncbi:putative zinc-binding metallopeptidase [Candidatus Pelagibacter sp.]|nr:putative zinc-binding metallopeptidase [Candidatus Pelagibacter sp.]
MSFFLITPAKSNSIFNLIKIPNLEIYELKTSNKLKYFYAKKPFRLGVQKNIVCVNSDSQTYDKKYQIISNNLDRYSKEFLKEINLKYIVMCENLSISGINTAGIPDHVMKTLILDLKFNEKYFERVIHHELFHIINDGFKDLFDENEWKNFNESTFKYADCSTCSKKLGLDTYANTNGFFTEYSKTTPSEDMAEVFSHLVSKNYKISNDPILSKKIEFIKNKLREIDKNFKF